MLTTTDMQKLDRVRLARMFELLPFLHPALLHLDLEGWLVIHAITQTQIDTICDRSEDVLRCASWQGFEKTALYFIGEQIWSQETTTGQLAQSIDR